MKVGRRRAIMRVDAGGDVQAFAARLLHERADVP